ARMPSAYLGEEGLDAFALRLDIGAGFQQQAETDAVRFIVERREQHRHARSVRDVKKAGLEVRHRPSRSLRRDREDEAVGFAEGADRLADDAMRGRSIDGNAA